MMNSVGTPWLWGSFAAVIVVMLAIDLLLQGRKGAHTMTLKQAASWSLVWVSLSLLFNFGFWYYLNETAGRAVADTQALAFLTGYLIEKALAVDNVFVWLMLFSYFAVPANLQRRVLIYGVLGAIVLRTIMIFAGSWLVSQFQWLLYLFGAFLLFTGIKMALAKEDDSAIGDKPLVKWLRSHLRMTDSLEGERFSCAATASCSPPAGAGADPGRTERRDLRSGQHSGDLRRDYRSVHRPDLQPVRHHGSARHVLPAGQRSGAFLDAEIWPVGDPGVYRHQDADYRLLPHPDRRVARRGGKHPDAYLADQRLGQSPQRSPGE